MGDAESVFNGKRGLVYKGSGIFRWSVSGHLQEGQTREGLRPRRPENHGYGEQRGGALLGWDRKNWKGEMPKREPRDLLYISVNTPAIYPFTQVIR